jgi:hypothetical protein
VVAAQVLPRRREREPPVGALVEDPDRGQRPEEPVQRGRVRCGRGGQLIGIARPVAQQVGDPELGGDRHRAGPLVSTDEHLQLQVLARR